VEVNSTGGQGSRRAVAPSDDDECGFHISIFIFNFPSLMCFNFMFVFPSMDNFDLTLKIPHRIAF
jgi:hypothetical protein